MSRKITPLAYAIHAPDESPIFGGQTIHVSAEDDGAGMFVLIKSDLTGDENMGPGEVKLDCGELADVVAVAEMLRLAHGGEV